MGFWEKVSLLRNWGVLGTRFWSSCHTWLYYSMFQILIHVSHLRDEHQKNIIITVGSKLHRHRPQIALSRASFQIRIQKNIIRIKKHIFPGKEGGKEGRKEGRKEERARKQKHKERRKASKSLFYVFMRK